MGIRIGHLALAHRRRMPYNVFAGNTMTTYIQNPTSATPQVETCFMEMALRGRHTVQPARLGHLRQEHPGSEGGAKVKSGGQPIVETLPTRLTERGPIGGNASRSLRFKMRNDYITAAYLATDRWTNRIKGLEAPSPWPHHGICLT